jgi:hypothetical protein
MRPATERRLSQRRASLVSTHVDGLGGTTAPEGTTGTVDLAEKDHDIVGSVPAACRRVTIAERSERFLSSAVPDESTASIIRTFSLRGFGKSG